jgi:glutathione S-transferase
LKLHFCPHTRAITSLWMLEEVGQPYELERVDIHQPTHPSAAYRQINPMGKVPALQDGENAFGETAAILLYLADKFPQSRLAPPQGDPRRGRFLQWLMFSPSTLEPAMIEKRSGLPVQTAQHGWGDYARALDALERGLTPGPNLFGEAFTAADLYLAATLGYGLHFGMIEKRASFVNFAERGAARPAHKRAREIEARELARTSG